MRIVPAVVEEKSTYWNAQQVDARKAIKKAYLTGDKSSWEIADSLMVVAPAGESGAHNEESTARVKAIAEENDVTSGSLRNNRAVAEVFPPALRDAGASFSVHRLFARAHGTKAPAKLARYVADGRSLRYRDVEAHLKPPSPLKAAPSKGKFLDEVVDGFNRHFPAEPVEPDVFPVLTEHDVLNLRIVAHDIARILEELGKDTKDEGILEGVG